MKANSLGASGPPYYEEVSCAPTQSISKLEFSFVYTDPQTLQDRYVIHGKQITYYGDTDKLNSFSNS